MALGDETREMINRRIAGTVMLAQAFAGRIESDMKSEARWTDRTTNARNGLTAVTTFTRQGDKTIIVIDMGHSVVYGKWLEVSNGGKYAVVQPIHDRFKPQISSGLQALWRPS